MWTGLAGAMIVLGLFFMVASMSLLRMREALWAAPPARDGFLAIIRPIVGAYETLTGWGPSPTMALIL